jgi:protein KIAA0825
VSTVISAVQTGASMYQAMTIILACFIQFWNCMNTTVPRIAFLFQDILPAGIKPLGKSVLLQILISGLYSEFRGKAECLKNNVKFFERKLTKNESSINNNTDEPLQHKNSVCSFDSTASPESIALAVAEALCGIDEDNKHTEEIDELLTQAKLTLESEDKLSKGCDRVEQSLQMSEILVSDLLISCEGKRSLKVI